MPPMKWRKQVKTMRIELHLAYAFCVFAYFQYF